MVNVSWTLVTALLTGMLWVMGAVLHWYNIRRQEQLIARLRRMSHRRRPETIVDVIEVEPAEQEPDALTDCLRPAKHWTVG